MNFGPLACLATDRNSNCSKALRNQSLAGKAEVAPHLTTLSLLATTASLRPDDATTASRYYSFAVLQLRATTVSLYYRLALALCRCSNFQRTRPGTWNQAAARGRLHIANAVGRTEQCSVLLGCPAMGVRKRANLMPLVHCVCLSGCNSMCGCKFGCKVAPSSPEGAVPRLTQNAPPTAILAVDHVCRAESCAANGHKSAARWLACIAATSGRARGATAGSSGSRGRAACRRFFTPRRVEWLKWREVLTVSELVLRSRSNTIQL